MSTSYPLTNTLTIFRDDMRAGNSILQRNLSAFNTAQPFSDSLVIIVSNCLIFANGIWNIKSPYTGNETLSDLLAQLQTYNICHVGRFTIFSGNTINFNGSHLQNLADPVNSSDAATKKFVEDRLNALSSTSTPNSQVLNQVVSFCNSLNSTDALNVITVVNSVNANIATETTRATDAESNLQTTIDALTTRCVALEAQMETVYQYLWRIHRNVTPV
jgi:hypothetical protein